MTLVEASFVFLIALTFQPTYIAFTQPSVISSLSLCLFVFSSKRFLPFGFYAAHGQSNHGEKK
jgi:hypothetical protein